MRLQFCVVRRNSGLGRAWNVNVCVLTSSLRLDVTSENTFCCRTPGLVTVLLVIIPSFLEEDVAMSFLAVSWGGSVGVLLREWIWAYGMSHYGIKFIIPPVSPISRRNKVYYY